MIYLWLIGAVVLAGADILLGTIYLLIIAVAHWPPLSLP